MDAERYDRTRLPYPEALIARIADGGPGRSGRSVVDVGCGTGIEARQLLAAGCTVLGVEPDERMAAFARRSGIEVEEATFESWDPAGRRFDALVAATSWHWVDPIAGATKAAAVLRPGGRFVACCHAFELPAEVAEALAASFARVMPDAPFDLRGMQRRGLDGYQPLLTRIAADLREVGGFGEFKQWRYPWQKPYTRAEFLDQLPTFGGLTRLPADKLTQVLTDVGAAVDALGGTFTAPYATVAVTATRT